MLYKRLHIRVPASGDVTLLKRGSIVLSATAINVSAGGIGLSAPSHLLDRAEYQVQIHSPAYGVVQFAGVPIHQSDACIGMKITSIDADNLHIIHKLVEDFQLTEDFIRHIESNSIIDDWFTDDSGNDLSVTFESSGV